MSNNNNNNNNNNRQDRSDKEVSLDEKLVSKIEELKNEVNIAHEREKRSLADYQNLLRRTQEQRQKLVKSANKQLIQVLLPALENLDRATEEINDSGLDMVVSQLWSSLEDLGLQKIEAKGRKFDLDTMEVVDRQGQGETVTKVVSQGYKLGDEVVQHAKVIVGDLQANQQE